MQDRTCVMLHSQALETAQGSTQGCLSTQKEALHISGQQPCIHICCNYCHTLGWCCIATRQHACMLLGLHSKMCAQQVCSFTQGKLDGLYTLSLFTATAGKYSTCLHLLPAIEEHSPGRSRLASLTLLLRSVLGCNTRLAWCKCSCT